jgi:uncharacterized membrane protein
MYARQHSTVSEGLVTGLIGALFLAAWYLGSDAAHGRLLHTPSVLGQVFLAADSTPVTRSIVPQAVMEYTALHVVVFLVVGVLLAAAVHTSLRHPTWRSGMIIGLAIGIGMVMVFLFLVPSFEHDASLRWSVLLGSVVAFLVMAVYLWRRHPSLGQAVRETEAPGPPHPPGGPRV